MRIFANRLVRTLEEEVKSPLNMGRFDQMKHPPLQALLGDGYIKTMRFREVLHNTREFTTRAQDLFCSHHQGGRVGVAKAVSDRLR